MSLRFSLIAASAALAFAATTAFASPQAASTTAAAPAKKELTSSQQHMSDCSKQAAGKKGAEFKAAVSACMKGEPAAAAPTAKQTQQEKMKSCNADAKTKALKGDARKTFMKDCLSNHP
ncbi:PsiF family protein [Dyella subtropica]|uniref:PsiF family protein n=1 Tax=Dyella subtropica TaxID=2992127 RepID=UPI0022589764|nr:PsiF family protein [Dyella subtropica]